MRKFTVILIIALCSICLASYDNSNVEVVIGGYGVPAINGTANSINIAWIDTTNIITRTGTVNSVTFRIERPVGYTPGNEIDDLSILFLSDEGGGSYQVRAKVDCTAEFNAHAIGTWNLEKTGLSVSVTKGWILGLYLDDATDTPSVKRHTATGHTVKYKWLGAEPAVDDTLSSLTTTSDAALLIEATMSMNEYVVYDDSTGFGDGDIVPIPAFTGDNYYICLEGVDVPNTEDLQIAAYYTAADGTDTVAYTVNLSYDGAGGDDDLMAIHTGSVFADTYSESIASQEGDEQSIWIHHDLTNDKLEGIFCNYEDGTGGQGDADVQHISLTDRTPLAAGIDLSSLIIRHLVITNTGTNAAIARVIVCRKPIIAVGDSFVSSQSGGKTVLNGPTQHLDDDDAVGFTEHRYVVNGGISGNQLLTTIASNHTAVIDRWDDPVNNRDLCAFRDGIYVFVNGPGINDIDYAGNIDNATEQQRFIAGLAGAVGKMTWDALENNEVAICSINKYDSAASKSTFQRDTVKHISELLQGVAFRAGIPYIDFFGKYAGAYADDVHLDSTGEETLATYVVDGYENNRVPSNPFKTNPLGRGREQY